MSIYSNPCISKLTPYVPGKTEEALKRELNIEHIIKLASNENPLGPSPHVLSAIQQAAMQSHRYPDDQAPELRQSIAKKWGLTADHVQFGAGSSELLDMLVQSFVDDGGEMIVTQHGFGLYFILASMHRVKLNIVPDQAYHQDLDAVLKAINPSTRAIFIANPNNPTGTWIEGSRMRYFIEQVPKHVLIVIDEAYLDYMTMPEYDSMAHGIAQHDNLVVLHTLSKAYGLAGLRFGYSLSHPSICTQLNKARKPFNISNTTLAAAKAALSDQDHIDKTIEMNQSGMKQLCDALDELGLNYLARSGNFLTVDFGEKAGSIADALMQQGIIVRPLTPYKMPNHLRITIGTEDETKQLIKMLPEILAAYE